MKHNCFSNSKDWNVYFRTFKTEPIYVTTFKENFKKLHGDWKAENCPGSFEEFYKILEDSTSYLSSIYWKSKFKIEKKFDRRFVGGQEFGSLKVYHEKFKIAIMVINEPMMINKK